MPTTTRGRSAAGAARTLAGCWLLAYAWVGDYGGPGPVDAAVGDAVCGSALLALVGLRVLGLISPATTELCSGLVGVALVLAPLLLDYGFGADSTLATCVDAVIGAVLVGAALRGSGRPAETSG
ncbi:hypothetical protein [Actinokineospora pegani]|uniref:hypothetical protein n=1 Tax=Actinokineospora pegani TaxID=2654637 RepID=UPI0012EAABDC|nr:hypothetical protein [Actinokineospora pegani]